MASTGAHKGHMAQTIGGSKEYEPARILGTVTIGQSPRTDLIPELKAAMGLEEDGRSRTPVKVIEAGALDGLTLEEVEKLAPQPGDYVLVTRMADGTPVKIAEKHILRRMEEQIKRLVAEGADVVALVCTGEFPEFPCEKLLVKPQLVLFHAVSAVAAGRRLGVLLPDEDQIEQGYLRWSAVHGDRESPRDLVRIEAASPYGDPAQVEEAARKLKEWGAEIIVMDCIGYTMAMKERVRSLTGVPVLLARSILGRVIAELL